MSISNIVSCNVSQSQQNGFSITGYLATVVVAGVVTTSMLPAIRDVVETADYNALSTARGALISAIQVNYQMARLRGGNKLLIDGVEVSTRFGHPVADASSLRSYATLEGFDIEELHESVRIWSPGRLYCVTYTAASAPQGVNSWPVLSEIVVEADGGCV